MGSKQRGYIVAENDNGTLERVDGSNTYIGSATLDTGRAITKRFRRQGSDEASVIESWEKWQGRKSIKEDTEEIMDYQNSNNAKCPFSGSDCTGKCPLFSSGNGACALLLGGIGLYNMSCNFAKLDMSDALELIAMSIEDSKRTKTEGEKLAPKPSNGINEYFEGKTFVAFVNRYSRGVYHEYKRFCQENGYEPVVETELSGAIVKQFPELLKKGVRGGSIFEAA